MSSCLPKLVFTDIDGVWTDGGMYYDEHGNEWKRFNTSDSAGVLFLRRLGIPVCIITGESAQSVKRRAEKLKVDHLIQGSHTKLQDALVLVNQLGLSLAECAYIGDDIIDLPLLNAVGISGAPANSPRYVQDAVQIVTQKPGGFGAFREFIETILAQNGYGDKWLINQG